MQDNNFENKITKRIKCNKLPILELQQQQQPQQNNLDEECSNNGCLLNNKNLSDFKKSIFRFSMTSISTYEVELEQQMMKKDNKMNKIHH